MASASIAAFAGFGWPHPHSNWWFDPGAEVRAQHKRDVQTAKWAARIILGGTLLAILLQGAAYLVAS